MSRGSGVTPAGTLPPVAVVPDVPVDEVRDLVIWGNHSSTQFPDAWHATIGGRPAPDVIGDEAIDCDFRVSGRFHAAHSPRQYEALTKRTGEADAELVPRGEQRRDRRVHRRIDRLVLRAQIDRDVVLRLGRLRVVVDDLAVGDEGRPRRYGVLGHGVEHEAGDVARHERRRHADHYLALHPDIFMAEEKELNFFVEQHHWGRGVDWYRQQFRRAPHGALLGDVSPDYSKFPHYGGVPPGPGNGEDCMTLGLFGWGDAFCETPHRYICK